MDSENFINELHQNCIKDIMHQNCYIFHILTIQQENNVLQACYFLFAWVIFDLLWKPRSEQMWDTHNKRHFFSFSLKELVAYIH